MQRRAGHGFGAGLGTQLADRRRPTNSDNLSRYSQPDAVGHKQTLTHGPPSGTIWFRPRRGRVQA
jgi:hypothetical protein